MEAGGLMAGVSWTEFDFLLQGEEESEVMAQLLLGGDSGEGGHRELPCWPDQAPSAAYCDGTGCSLAAAPSAYEGYHLSNSNQDVVPGDLDPGLVVVVQDQGAAEFLDVFPNRSLTYYGNGGLNQADLDGFGMSVVDSACATNKRKHLADEEQLDGQTRMQGRQRARRRKGEAKVGGMKRAKQSGDSDDDDDDDDDDEDADLPVAGGSPTSCCTCDSDSNGSQDQSADAEASPGANAHAGRGAAITEPQSIYARKRRQRINERLKTLQNLVPNGTKVDISTMLEEAVHYVKFLQLQIKLLSSDDTWMYAPIAYNGVDIGVGLNMER